MERAKEKEKEKEKEKDKVAAKARARGKAPVGDKDKEKAKAKEEPTAAGRGKDAETINNIHTKRSIIMPGGDRTGPMGMGPMTGRAAGYCAGSPTAGFANAPGGRGMGGGRGFGGGRGGRGRRNQFYATGLTGWQRAAASQEPPQANQPQTGTFEEQSASPPLAQEQEVELLKQQAEQLSNSLEDIKQRLEEMGMPTQPTSNQ